MKELLIEEEGLNKQGGSEETGRGGGSSDMTISLENISGGNVAYEAIEWNKVELYNTTIT